MLNFEEVDTVEGVEEVMEEAAEKVVLDQDEHVVAVAVVEATSIDLEGAVVKDYREGAVEKAAIDKDEGVVQALEGGFEEVT